MIKLSDFVMERIAAAGVRHVFFVPGGAAMHLNDSLGRTPGLQFVANLHEHASAVGAEAYGKLTNELGVAMVTAGPGSTNALTGVASAWVNSAPVLFLSGQVKREDIKGRRAVRQIGLQEVDIVSVVSPITKYAVTITDPATVRFHVEKALHVARSGRPGPVWLCFPLDVQAAAVDPESQPGFTPEPPPGISAPELRDKVVRTIELLNASERPILLAGGGVRIAGAEARFLELVRILGIPVQTTWVGADLVANDHPLFAGRPGSFAPRGANFAIQNSDFLLALGARLDFATTGYSRERFARAARRVAVDVDAAELEKMEASLEFPIWSDARAFVEELLSQGQRVAARDRSAWFGRIREWMAKYPVITPDFRGRVHDTSTYVVVEALSELLEPADVIVEGSSGIHSEIFFLAFRTKEGQRVLADGSYGAMGYGVPAAIGACLASGRRTVLVEGDGSLQPNLQELETIRRSSLPIKIVVINNGGYASIRASQQRYFGRLVAADPTSGLSFPQVEKIASAYGIPCTTVAREAELRAKLRETLEAPGPAICEVRVPAEEDRVPRLASLQKADGRMVSRPLEDLFPFLDREEFRSNMIIPPLPEE